MDTISISTPTNVRGVPENIAAELKKIGATFNADVLKTTRELYLPLIKAQERDSFTIESDILYGTDTERHLLDIHVPNPKPSTAVPVVMFFHGGGFVEGYKNSAGEFIYGNVSDYFARNGLIGVNCTYRLAPGAPWPAGAEDVGAAVKWVRENIAAYGGDPDQVYVMGHSAGSAHVAQFALHKDLQPAGGHGAAGVILMSGTYTLNTERIAANQAAYYGDDTSLFAARQLVGNTAWGDFKVFITFAEFDPPMFPISAMQLAAELSRTTQRLPRVKQLLGHNHPSSTLAVGTGDPTVAPEILDFILNPSDAVG